MGKFYTLYMGSYPNGQKRLLHIPDFEPTQISLQTNQTISTATANYSNVFDQTYTYFTNSLTRKEYMSNMGFTDIVLISDHYGEKWYFNNTKYIEFPQSGNNIYFRGGDASTISVGVNAFSRDACPCVSLKANGQTTPTAISSFSSLRLTDINSLTFSFIVNDSFANYGTYFNDIEETIPDTDPYVEGGGSSGGGGGEGDFDDTSDTIGIPSLPSISGLNTGFFTAFVCTQAQLQNVSNYLWTDVISDILDTSTGLGDKVDALKKMVTSPYDAIMGCSLVPVSPPTGGSKEIKMYGVIQTGISLPYASSRWVEVDCGTLNIKEFWGSYLDYSPYTKTTSLYLPYIGVVSVDIDLIMSKALQVVYHVDILSGICIAYIIVDGSVKFQYQGHCSTTIPVTSSDYSGAIQSGLGLVGNIANVVSSGVSGGLSGGLGGATLGAVGSAISQAPSVASNVMGMKPDIKSGGGVGSSGGILGVQKPFLIIERPKQSVPAFQNGFSGYPCNMTKKLSDLTGYTEVERINLENISLTEDEKNELLQILESGVYL